MPSQLYSLARVAWFEKRGLACPNLGAKQPPLTITYEDMLEFDGPREYSKCEYCTTQEWYSRVSGKNCYVIHECQDPEKHDFMKQRCAVVFKSEWRHVRRNYNFALSNAGTPPLPGRKCLFVVADANRLCQHGAHPGFMIWRKRMSMYQTTLCDYTKIGEYNLRDYDFIVMTVHGVTPIIAQKDAPPIFLYGHDHHTPALQVRAQQLLDCHPAALLTPYPSIWTNAFKIHKDTRVVFTPYLSDPAWSEMNSTFEGRQFDVMVIGTAGPIYPERRVMHDLLKKKKAQLPFKLKLWEAPKPMPLAEKISAAKYGAPPLALWSKFLAQSKICIFGQDKFGYLVNKYAEIAGACSLMVAPQLSECKTVGLIANHNYIPLKRPIQHELIPQLTRLVARFDREGKPVALRGLQWFQEKCSFWLYDYFWNKIETLLGGR